jgi:hypothetical protein
MGIFLQIHTGEGEGKRRENGTGAGEVRYVYYRECGRKVQGQCPLVLLVKVV